MEVVVYTSLLSEDQRCARPNSDANGNGPECGRNHDGALNHFAGLLVRSFGPWSSVVMDSVSMLIMDGDGHRRLIAERGMERGDAGNVATLNVYDLSAAVIPSVVRCFIESVECSRFNIVWYRNSVRNKGTIRRDNYRLLSGEDSDYLLSRTHFVLQNHFYPPIQCQWTFGHDEIQCDATNFVNALHSVQ